MTVDDITERATDDVDEVVLTLAHYATSAEVAHAAPMRMARYALMDALACAHLALRHPECTKLLGPHVPGTVVPHGARVPGTAFVLDPVQAAFDLGALIRWLDFNDTWLAAEWAHPSDNLGGLLMLADYLSQVRVASGRAPLRMRQVLMALIKTYEMQGVLGLTNSLNRAGVDHVLFVAIATAALSTVLLDGSEEDVRAAITLAWMDGGPLRAYRHAPDTGSRKSWAGGDATSRGVRLALLVHRGEMGYRHVLSTPTWGFADARLHGTPIALPRPLGTLVMENILFKVPFPTEFHGQTAVEAALALRPTVQPRLEAIQRIVITTQEAGRRIIDKTGPLHNPADRDHCIQYMVAYALLFGRLHAEDYSDAAAADQRIDALRALMVVEEEPAFSRDYLDPAKRSIANAVQVFFADGTATERIAVEYPLGHPRRRAEALPELDRKFTSALASCLPPRAVERIQAACADQERLEEQPVHEFVQLFASPPAIV